MLSGEADGPDSQQLREELLDQAVEIPWTIGLIDLLTACPGIIQPDLEHTQSAYDVLGYSDGSVFRNYMTVFILACVRTATILARVMAMLVSTASA
jgi:hypothetical protein